MMAILVAVLIGALILGVGVWAVQLLAIPAPPEPDPDEVMPVAATDYRCTVCGMRLTVTHAQDGEVKAPKHCREEMVPA